MILSGLDRVFTKLLPPYSGEGLLAKRCFAVTRCRGAYQAAWEQIAQAANKLDLKGTAERLSNAMLQPHTHRFANQIKLLQSYLENRKAQIGNQ